MSCAFAHGQELELLLNFCPVFLRRGLILLYNSLMASKFACDDTLAQAITAALGFLFYSCFLGIHLVSSRNSLSCDCDSLRPLPHPARSAPPSSGAAAQRSRSHMCEGFLGADVRLRSRRSPFLWLTRRA